MHQYKVPQFVDRETKIILFITIRQFIVLLGVSIGLAIVYFLVSNLTVFIIIATLVMSITISLLFVKFNGRPLYKTFSSMLWFYISSQSYAWKAKNIQTGKVVQRKKPEVNLNKQQLDEFVYLLDQK